MVNDFVIGDALHLRDLGITRRLLEGYMNTSLTNVDASLSKNDISEINEYLNKCRGPIEIRSFRAIRSFQEFSNWKGREFKVFLYYLSIPIFKAYLKKPLYDHFLLYFCAMTIMGSEEHLKYYLEIADDCIKHYLNGFIQLYGKGHITSNFHYLSHLVEDVKRFGNLDSFSAYPRVHYSKSNVYFTLAVHLLLNLPKK